MSLESTKESQYQRDLDLKQIKGLTGLGVKTSRTWYDDPRRLLFVLARYKFVSKMLSGSANALEVGCGDAFAIRIVQQEVDRVCAVDFDPVFVNDANERMEDKWRFDCRVHDILSGPVEGDFDAAYSLDVIEHIEKADEERFMANVTASLNPQGILILGTPSLQSQAYASDGSITGHVNCKDSGELKSLMSGYFDRVLMFSMNDEVVHTGFSPMAHYLFAIGSGKRSGR